MTVQPPARRAPVATRPRSKLELDQRVVRHARSLARRAGAPVVKLARTHTTVSVERAVLRLAGLSGADPDGIPWVNRLVDAVSDACGLEHGIALPSGTRCCAMVAPTCSSWLRRPQRAR